MLLELRVALDVLLWLCIFVQTLLVGLMLAATETAFNGIASGFRRSYDEVRGTFLLLLIGGSATHHVACRTIVCRCSGSCCTASYST